MGATNRPKDVDRAILRRMPSTFHIGLPSVQQRISILKRILVNSGIFYIFIYSSVNEWSCGKIKFE
jgi:SpoVK/Ycf46/Vps4 family AAA+-type ATPase